MGKALGRIGLQLKLNLCAADYLLDLNARLFRGYETVICPFVHLKS